MKKITHPTTRDVLVALLSLGTGGLVADDVLPKEDGMGSIPSYLLKKLYAKGSLKNTATGLELAIRNTLAKATIVGLAPLRVDGVEYPLENTMATLPDGRHVSAPEVSADSPLSFAVGDTVTIRVEGEPLSPGPHKLIISPKTKEAGQVEIFALDTVS